MKRETMKHSPAEEQADALQNKFDEALITYGLPFTEMSLLAQTIVHYVELELRKRLREIEQKKGSDITESERQVTILAATIAQTRAAIQDSFFYFSQLNSMAKSYALKFFDGLADEMELHEKSKTGIEEYRDDIIMQLARLGIGQDGKSAKDTYIYLARKRKKSLEEKTDSFSREFLDGIINGKNSPDHP